MSSASINYEWPTVNVEKIVQDADDASAARLSAEEEEEEAVATEQDAENIPVTEKADQNVPEQEEANNPQQQQDDDAEEEQTQEEEQYFEDHHGDSMYHRRPSAEPEQYYQAGGGDEQTEEDYYYKQTHQQPQGVYAQQERLQENEKHHRTSYPPPQQQPKQEQDQQSQMTQQEEEERYYQQQQQNSQEEGIHSQQQQPQQQETQQRPPTFQEVEQLQHMMPEHWAKQRSVSPAPPKQEQPQQQADQHAHVRFDPVSQSPALSAASHTRRTTAASQWRTRQAPQKQQQRRRPPLPADYPQNTSMEDVYDVLIIGGGVVGLATLRAATLAGYKAVVVEAAADLLSGASSGNSGIACTGVDATPGTLERALIRDAISQLRPFLKTHRIPHRDCGSLVCQWDWDKMSRDKRYESPLSKILAESIDAGDSHARKLDGAEVGQWEPNVSPLCVGAVHIPGEIVVDPWLYAIALAAHARENGAKVFTNFEYDPASSRFDSQQGVWNVVRRRDKDHLIEMHPPAYLRARAVVNATGIVADLIQGGTAGVRRPHWTAKPRRGQYRVFAADQYSYITHPIQPVPSQRTKGIFVFSTLYDHIVVGPTAEEQESRFDKSINPSVADDLTTYVLRIIPDLDPLTQHLGEYVGIRPATEHRDYQISMQAHCNWIAAAGIRSTGLTASLGIGRHMVHLLEAILPPPTPPASIRTSPLPDIKELVSHFNSNADGSVLIHGYLYRVTHPLTRMGFHTKTGIASVAGK